MNPFWKKATDAAASAKLLLDAGHADGAANRAYYAMFNAARAFLDLNTDVEVIDVRRHSAVLKLFAARAVKPGLIEPRLHSAMHEAFEVRAVADYSGTNVNEGHVRDLIELMKEFLAAIEPDVAGKGPTI